MKTIILYNWKNPFINKWLTSNHAIYTQMFVESIFFTMATCSVYITYKGKLP